MTTEPFTLKQDTVPMPLQNKFRLPTFGTKNPQSVNAFVLAAHACSIDNQKHTNAAMLLLHGRPLLEYVIATLKKTRVVNHITVIGPDELDELYCRRLMDERIAADRATLHDLLWGVHTIADTQHQPAIVLSGDNVFLSSSDIDRFVARAHRTQADLVIPGVVSKSRRCGFKVVYQNRNTYSGGAPIYIRKRQYTTSAILRMQELRQDAPQLLGSNALMTMLVTLHNRQTQAQISQRVLPFKSSAYCRIPINAESLDQAKNYIKRPWTNRYRSVTMIVNPNAGQGMQMPKLMKRIIAVQQRTTDRFSDIQTYVKKITEYLSDFDIFPEVIFSKSSEDATRLARQCASKNTSLVIAVGGDGTINSVARGLVGTDTPLGVIPVGTINLFAVQQGIPLSLRSSCQLIADGKAQKIDVGRVKDTFFTTVMGIGFDAQVIHETDSWVKKLLGATSFIVSGITSAFTFPFNPIRITIDGNPRVLRGYLGLVANGKYYGIHSVVSPSAKVDDGRLDLCLFKSKGFWQLLRYLWGLRSGTLIKYGQVEFHQIKKMTIHGHTPIHVDGEPYGSSPVTVEDNPRSLTVIC